MFRINRVGHVYGDYTVQAYAHSGVGGARWECLCGVCGKVSVVLGSNLTSGNSKSCCGKGKTKKHGHAGTPLYKIWVDMRRRCNNANRDDYLLYGGRGIKVCPEWDDFDVFLSDMGERPDACSLDRINTDGDYTPSNCRWATATTQARNKRNNKMFTYKGETKTLAEWAEIKGRPMQTLYSRLNRGVSGDDMFAIHLQKKGNTHE